MGVDEVDLALAIVAVAALVSALIALLVARPRGQLLRAWGAATGAAVAIYLLPTPVGGSESFRVRLAIALPICVLVAFVVARRYRDGAAPLRRAVIAGAAGVAGPPVLLFAWLWLMCGNDGCFS